MVIKLDINGFMMITNLVVSYCFSKRKKNCEGSPLRGRYQGQALRVCFEKIFLLVVAQRRPKEYFSSQNLDIDHSVGQESSAFFFFFLFFGFSFSPLFSKNDKRL